VATERNNDASTVSRDVVLRFSPTQAGTTLTATHQGGGDPPPLSPAPDWTGGSGPSPRVAESVTEGIP